MSTRTVSVKNFDLGFAAACFACFLYVFGLGANQTPYSKEAASYFAICIPILLASSILLNVLTLDRMVRLGQFKKTIFLFLRAVILAAMLIGLLGVHSMFKCISEDSASLFAMVCAGCLLIVFVIYRLSLPGRVSSTDAPVD